MGINKLYDPDKLIISTDHEPIAVSLQAAERQKKVREIVKKYGIKNFFDTGRGGHGHVFPVEMGLIKPGMFVEAYDVHVTNFGSVGALAIPEAHLRGQTPGDLEQKWLRIYGICILFLLYNYNLP